jgi:hypothetical protein
LADRSPRRDDGGGNSTKAQVQEDGMSADDCFKKTYVKLYYIPPRDPEQPEDCKKVKITRPPEITIFTGQISRVEGVGKGDLIGLDLHCSVISTEGAGGIILLLQVSGYIEWEIEFVSAPPLLVCRPPGPFDISPPPIPGDLLSCQAPTPGKVVRETHRVYFSVPMLYKLAGPRIALMMRSPLKLRLAAYAAQIANAFLKLRQLDRVLALVTAPKKGFCPEDIRALEAGLKAAEKEMNSSLQWVASGNDDIASLMKGRPGGVGQFAGSRTA